MVVMIMMMVMVVVVRVWDFLNGVPNELRHGPVASDAQLVVRKTAHVTEEDKKRMKHDQLKTRKCGIFSI